MTQTHTYTLVLPWFDADTFVTTDYHANITVTYVPSVDGVAEGAVDPFHVGAGTTIQLTLNSIEYISQPGIVIDSLEAWVYNAASLPPPGSDGDHFPITVGSPVNIGVLAGSGVEGRIGISTQYHNAFGAGYADYIPTVDLPGHGIGLHFINASSADVDPDPDPDPPPAPSRIVVPGVINSGCRLGCATDYQVLATSRCGDRTVCELTGISDLTFGLVQDDTSEAVIVIDLPTDGSEDTCCDCVGGLRSWIHSVMILRDGQRVWGPGPIVNVLYKKDQVAVTARDVSAWLDVRLIHNDLDFTDEDPLVVAQAIIDDAMAPDDPCGIATSTYLQAPATLGAIDREYTAEDPSQYAGDAFRELARTSMDYTVVGSTILMGEPLVFGPYTTLTDEHFQVDLEVEERGLEGGTKWVVQSDTARGEAGGLDPYYGLIEQLAEEAQIDDDDQAAVVAENRRKASNPVPLYINIPEGARLSPEAPVCFEQLVPGTLINVNVRHMCREVYSQLKLTAVRVHVPGDGDEEVGITLSPVGIVSDAEAG